jgi:ribosome-associated protein
MDEITTSKTQKKNEFKALQELGEQLVALSLDQLKPIDMPEELLSAVIDAQKPMKHEAKRRQLQYIGRLMREIDPEPIRNALENIRHGDYHKAFLFKKMEKWRDALKTGNNDTIEEILAACPPADPQRLIKLAKNMRAATQPDKSLHASKLLMHYLKEVSALSRDNFS